ncbi:MAG: LysE family translocator [Spirochaetales bacterium]|nr:LysE family translocator [Spirochaetales bacterium]
MDTPSELLLSGLVMGLAAGLSPGPLLALVIGETIRHDRRMGIRVALAPLITDVPAVALSLLVFSRLAAYRSVLGAVSLAGAGFIGYLAWESLRSRGLDAERIPERPRSFRKGLVTNALSPHPYLFWITVGAPVVIRAGQSSLAAAGLYILGFYLLLVGSKITVALVVDRSKAWIRGRAYLWILRGLGVVLAVFAVLFLRDGLRLLGVLGGGSGS